MESSPIKSTLHPLLLIAAISVTALSLAGVGYFAGWLPGPGSKTVEPAAPNPDAQVVQSTTSTVPATPPAVSSSKEATTTAEPVAKPKKRHTRSTSTAVSPEPTSSHSPTASAACLDCGVVSSINEVMVEPAGSGVGAVAGGVVGGVLGNQIGKGNGRTVATVLGVAGGAYAGNAIEKSVKKTKRYDVVVRFDDGTTRTFSSATVPEWRTGDRVRLQNGSLTPRN